MGRKGGHRQSSVKRNLKAQIVKKPKSEPFRLHLGEHLTFIASPNPLVNELDPCTVSKKNLKLQIVAEVSNARVGIVKRRDLKLQISLRINLTLQIARIDGQIPKLRILCCSHPIPIPRENIKP